MSKTRGSGRLVKKSDRELERHLETALRLMEAGKHAEATDWFRKVLNSRSEDYVANINLGVCLLMTGSIPEASRILHRLHERHPNDEKLLDLCAKAYFHLQRFDIAIQFWRLLAKARPGKFEVWCNLALAASSSGKDIDALAYAFKALEIEPTNPVAHNNLGGALQTLLRDEEALQCYQTALELDPQNTDAISNLAITFQRQGRHEEALRYFERCKELGLSGSVQNADLTYKASFSLLSLGRFVEGWEAHEFGFAVLSNSGRNPKRKFLAKQWAGENLEGKRILVWREQGLGDELFLYSMLPDLQTTGAKIVIESDTRLVGLLSRSFSDAEVRPQSFNSLSGESTVEDYDFHSPLGSLARFLRRSIDDFHKSRRGYLVPDPNLVEIFGRRLKHFTGLKIGISWRTGIDFSNRAVNITALRDWFPWLLFKDVTFVNLFYGDGEAEIRAVEDNWGINILRWSDVDLRNDQESLAAIMCNLDLVISSDSAPAMLAGALGVPLYMYGGLGSSNFGTKKFLWFPHCKFFSPPDKAMASVMPLVAQAVMNDYGLTSISEQHQVA